MDFRELQYVVTVADCRNITQASKELFISQPSLSHALALPSAVNTHGCRADLR